MPSRLKRTDLKNELSELCNIFSSTNSVPTVENLDRLSKFIDNASPYLIDQAKKKGRTDFVDKFNKAKGSLTTYIDQMKNNDMHSINDFYKLFGKIACIFNKTFDSSKSTIFEISTMSNINNNDASLSISKSNNSSLPPALNQSSSSNVQKLNAHKRLPDENVQILNIPSHSKNVSFALQEVKLIPPVQTNLNNEKEPSILESSTIDTHSKKTGHSRSLSKSGDENKKIKVTTFTNHDQEDKHIDNKKIKVTTFTNHEQKDEPIDNKKIKVTTFTNHEQKDEHRDNKEIEVTPDQRDLFSFYQLDKEIMDKEIMDKEIMDKEIMDKEIMDKEIMDKEINQVTPTINNDNKVNESTPLLLTAQTNDQKKGCFSHCFRCFSRNK